MVSNIEKYYGFRFKIEKSIDPIAEESVRLEAKSVFDGSNMDMKDYLIYFHSLIIIADKEHFGFDGGLSSRAEEINIHYLVNPKQVKSGAIKFLNYRFEGPDEDKIVHKYSNSEMIGFNVDASYFDRNPQFLTYIITYIRKDLREAHRKIKISVSARPTQGYRGVISQENLIRDTKADLKYDRPIQLRLPLIDTQQRSDTVSDDESNKSSPAVNFYGTVGTVNANSGGQNISVNDVKISDIEKDLRQLSGYLASKEKVDEESLQIVDDAITASKDGSEEGLSSAIKKGGEKLLDHTEKIGARMLELYIKSQLGL